MPGSCIIESKRGESALYTDPRKNLVYPRDCGLFLQGLPLIQPTDSTYANTVTQISFNSNNVVYEHNVGVLVAKQLAGSL